MAVQQNIRKITIILLIAAVVFLVGCKAPNNSEETTVPEEQPVAEETQEQQESNPAEQEMRTITLRVAEPLTSLRIESITINGEEAQESLTLTQEGVEFQIQEPLQTITINLLEAERRGDKTFYTAVRKLTLKPDIHPETITITQEKTTTAKTGAATRTYWYPELELQTQEEKTSRDSSDFETTTAAQECSAWCQSECNKIYEPCTECIGMIPQACAFHEDIECRDICDEFLPAFECREACEKSSERVCEISMENACNNVCKNDQRRSDCSASCVGGCPALS